MAYSSGDMAVALHMIHDASATNAVITFAVKEASTTTELGDDVQTWIGATTTGLEHLISNEAHFTKISIRDLSTTDVPDDIDINVAGAASFDSVSVQVALVFRLRTGTAGRSFRGRMYLPFVASHWAAEDNASWNPTTTPTLQEFADNFASSFDGSGASGAKFGVQSRKLSVVTLGTTVTARTGYLGTQRRRARRPT
jgi:hypothetical protein